MDGDSHDFKDEKKVTGAESGQEDVTQAEDAQVEQDGTEYQKILNAQEARIKELEEQIAEASKTAETAEALRNEIESIKAQAADERIEYELRLAGARNVKAARALLEDHGGDVSALKSAEPWLFEGNKPSSMVLRGTTGLASTGIARTEDATISRWRRLAGLDDSDER